MMTMAMDTVNHRPVKTHRKPVLIATMIPQLDPVFFQTLLSKPMTSMMIVMELLMMKHPCMMMMAMDTVKPLLVSVQMQRQVCNQMRMSLLIVMMIKLKFIHRQKKLQTILMTIVMEPLMKIPSSMMMMVMDIVNLLLALALSLNWRLMRKVKMIVTTEMTIFT